MPDDGASRVSNDIAEITCRGAAGVGRVVVGWWLTFAVRPEPRVLVPRGPRWSSVDSWHVRRRALS